VSVHVRLKQYVRRCGIAVDSQKFGRHWKYLVQCGPDGPLEWHYEVNCEIITDEQFEAYLSEIAPIPK
jgi:hypothetical protein